MADSLDPTSDWLSFEEAQERLGVARSVLRRMLQERQLASVRREGGQAIPAAFFGDDGPLPELRGTLTVLADVGFSDEEAVAWLLAEEASLGSAPIEAIRAGRKTEVRRVAQALA